MSEETAADRGKRMLHESGYAKGGDVAEDTAIAKRVVRKAIRQHETAEHGGKHEPLKLRRGGKVEGEKAEARPDRRARGGATEHKGKGKPAVNIKIAAGGGQQANPAAEQMAAKAGLAKGVQMGAQMAAAKMGGGAPPGGGMPPGAGPGGPPPGAPPPGMMRRGGAMRAKGGSVPDDDENCPKGEDYDEDGKQRDKNQPAPDNGDGRKRGGSIARKSGGRAC